MRAYLERKLNETWYGGRKPGAVLTALEHLYHRLSSFHRKFNHRRRAPELIGKPIVVVGNLTAGGAGKTPLVIRLVELARTCGLKPGVVSRGYGRRSNEPLVVESGMDPRDTGDEPYLIAKRTGVPVAVDAARERAAHGLFSHGVNLVISDDGLQRLRLPRSVEICVTDQGRGFGNGRLIPAGPLREPVDRLESVDFVVEHLSAGSNPSLLKGNHMHLRPGLLLKLHGDETMPLSELCEVRSLHAIAGISHPERFFSMLQKAGADIEKHPFPDHHHYRPADFSSLPTGSTIVMTEKDAVKCRNLPLFDAWYLPVEAVLSEALETALTETFQAIARKYEAR